MSAAKGKAPSGPCQEAATELVGLLGQVAKGDHVAFRSLYDLTHRRLFCVALLLLKNRESAEDALQEAFIRIWTRAGTFDAERGMPLPWLARIVRNVSHDLVRLKSVRTDPLGDSHDLAADSAVSSFAVAAVNRCLATMERNHSVSWLMIHIDGLSRAEVALQMKVPLGTVKSWVFRSSQRIRAAVES